MSHKRVDIAGDDKALCILPPYFYKVLQYLCNRADRRGICFPSEEKIAAATGQSVRHAQRALDALHGLDLIRYARRGGIDMITGQKQTNAYMTNPFYLLVSRQNSIEARAIWSALKGKNGNGSIRLLSHTNQHQEPTPVNQHQLTSTRNQHQTTNTTPQKGDKPKDKNLYPEGADRHSRDGKDDYETIAGTDIQREAQPPTTNQSSGIGNTYVNPKLEDNPLPDEAHEGLADELRAIGISLPLARGFVVEYSYTRVKTALAAVEKMGDKAREPAGVFRSILQRQRIADSVPARKAKKTGDYQPGQYDEWLKS